MPPNPPAKSYRSVTFRLPRSLYKRMLLITAWVKSIEPTERYSVSKLIVESLIKYVTYLEESKLEQEKEHYP